MSVKSFVASNASTIFVFALLGATAWVGHRTGWKLPSLARLRADAAAAAPKEDWCADHNVPESRCIACRPELSGADPADWCKEHGVPESRCAACNPEILTGPPQSWCKAHDTPESQCTLCHPDIAVPGTLPKEEHDVSVSLVRRGWIPPDPATCQSHAARVQFASAESVRKVGLGFAQIEERPISAYLRANGEIEFDQARIAHISSRSAGTLWRVMRNVGDPVKAGDLLALVQAADVGRAKSDLVGALAAVDLTRRAFARAQATAASGLRTQTEIQEAESALHAAGARLYAAEQALLSLGLPASVQDLAGRPQAEVAESLRLLGIPTATARDLADVRTANLLPIQAPIDGVVIEREAVPGEVVTPEKVIFVVADATRVWAVVDVRVEDSHRLTIGQKVAFRPDGGDDDDVASGEISWIAAAADPKTRTVKVRVVLDNPSGRLRIHTFGTARITLRREPRAVVVPDAAVQWEGCCHVVFVRRTDEVFDTRKVRIGVRSAGLSEVLVGVLPGEVVVTTGSHVLKSEILKSRLGAGCADE